MGQTERTGTKAIGELLEARGPDLALEPEYGRPYPDRTNGPNGNGGKNNPGNSGETTDPGTPILLLKELSAGRGTRRRKDNPEEIEISEPGEKTALGEKTEITRKGHPGI